MKLNVATILTISRIVFIPLIVFFFILDDGKYRDISAYIFLLALITDYLDGFVARNFNQTTAFGAFLDPIADKLLVVITIFLACKITRFYYFYLVIINHHF